MKPLRLTVCLALLSAPGLAAAGVVIREGEWEGRAQFIVATAAAEYWLDRAGGGLSRLLDRDGRDWIAFRREPLAEFPASAAAGYRGLPNAVFGRGHPDAGAGHPGFDLCESRVVGEGVIHTASRSGRWAWTWTFTDSAARLRFVRTDPEHAYWCLYEGTPGGRFAPAQQFWGTDLGGPNFEVPDLRGQRFGRWRWAYFGDRAVPRAFAMAQVQPDELEDTFWYLGSAAGGDAGSPAGMVVFGFGRGPGTQPLLRTPQEFVFGLIEDVTPDAAGHAAVARHLVRWLDPPPPTHKPRVGELHFGPAQGAGLPVTGMRFAREFLPSGVRLLAVQANTQPDGLRLLHALRFEVAAEDGRRHVELIGEPRGAWSAPHPVPPGATLTGLSGTGGWWVDSLQFHFSEGSQTPRYGGAGGDYAFEQSVTRRAGDPTGEVRGLWGTLSTNGFLESIGLLTLPAE